MAIYDKTPREDLLRSALRSHSVHRGGRMFKFLLEFPNASSDSLADAAIRFALDMVEAIDLNFDCCAIRILFAIHELLSAGVACDLNATTTREHLKPAAVPAWRY